MHRLVVAVVLLSTLRALAQNPASDSQAISLAQQSIVAMTGGAPITDATLTGSATWIAGSDDETGTATLRAKSTDESRADLNLTGGTRTDIRNDTVGYPQGESVLADGTVRAWALHNCWINSSWFFPALSYLSATSDPSLIFSYVGQEEGANGPVQHIRVYRYLAGQKPDVISLTQQLSTTDIYLDSASSLPVAFTFNSHPDSDAATNISVEIDFSNYRTVSEILVPFHVQKLIQGGLALDVVIANAAFNSGLPDSLFAVQ